jgi:tetratricopeptide (TPR) repeat protein
METDSDRGMKLGRMPWPGWRLPFLLGLVAFGVYLPSLKSDFVYDGRIEIVDEGFVTNLSNLPAVLSLKVLGMKTVLAPRPGDILYLMAIASVCGTHPFGYHLCSNLLHAMNVALLFVSLRRLVDAGKMEMRLVLAAVTLVFALHPIAVEAVAEVSYSADLLVTFFTLLALLAATNFQPGDRRRAWMMGTGGTLCAFAAVASKESGVATSLVLIAYWAIFRRREQWRPWLVFLGSALAVTGAFMIALVLSAPPELQTREHLSYLGGSFSSVFWIQPRLWIFMIGKLLWPARLAGQYTAQNLCGLSIPAAQMLLVAVVALQAWLGCKSRIGALGVFVYWFGLATVSNFVPLFLPIADRFYYLPLAGVAMQLAGLLSLISRWRMAFVIALGLLIVALVSFTILTVQRQAVFANELSFWRDTSEKNPDSATAHDSYGIALAFSGRVDEAIRQFKAALACSPNFANAHENYANALALKGEMDDAVAEYRKALQLQPESPHYHFNLGCAFRDLKRWDEAIAQFKETIRLQPDYTEAKEELAKVQASAGKPNAK